MEIHLIRIRVNLYFNKTNIFNPIGSCIQTLYECRRHCPKTALLTVL